MNPHVPAATPESSHSVSGNPLSEPIYIDRPLPNVGTAPTPGTVAPAMLTERVEGLVAKVKTIVSAERVEALLAAAERFGQWAVLGGAGLTLVYAIYGAIKFNSFGLFLTGLILTGVLAVALYIASRFLRASADAIRQTPSQIASRAFLECAGLLAVMAALGLLVAGTVSAIQLGSLIPLLPAVLGVLVLFVLGGVALHPELVNVSLVPGDAAEEAIGLLAFLAKAGVKSTALFFGLLSLGGGLALLASFFRAGQGFAAAITSVVQWLPVTAPIGLAGSVVVLLACLLPIANYFIFLMETLWVSLLRAVLATPREVAALRKVQS